MKQTPLNRSTTNILSNKQVANANFDLSRQIKENLTKMVINMPLQCRLSLPLPTSLNKLYVQQFSGGRLQVRKSCLKLVRKIERTL